VKNDAIQIALLALLGLIVVWMAAIMFVGYVAFRR
jgi:hypothetical protein